MLDSQQRRTFLSASSVTPGGSAEDEVAERRSDAARCISDIDVPGGCTPTSMYLVGARRNDRQQRQLLRSKQSDGRPTLSDAAVPRPQVSLSLHRVYAEFPAIAEQSELRGVITRNSAESMTVILMIIMGHAWPLWDTCLCMCACVRVCVCVCVCVC